MNRRKQKHLGKAFSDSLVLDGKVGTRFGNVSDDPWWQGAGRALMFAVIFVVVFFVLIFRLFQLTVVDGHRYRVLADNNRTRELVRHAPRGMLVDRKGLPLVTNVPQYRLIRPCEGDEEHICAKRLTKAEGEKMQTEGLDGGHFLEVDYRRQYAYPEALAHVTGYVGEITPEELADDYYDLRGYLLGDRIGRTGAEVVYEDRLRGRNGRELVEVDVSGKILRTLGIDEAEQGDEVVLSVDAELSAAVAEVFPEGFKGAVIVSKPQTGEVLAMHSSPTFSVNKFSLGMTDEEYQDLISDPDRPMFNRSIGGVYPPASTFKMVTSIASLEEGEVTAETTIEDTGIITVGEFSFANWYYNKYGGTDGLVNLAKALARSNDVYYYKVGEMVGITKLSAWARKFGIGRLLGIELAGEEPGLIPDPDWKKQRFDTAIDRKQRNDQWYLGDTYHVSIGQGYLLTTPLQVNSWTNSIANGGKLCRPTIQRVDGQDHVASCDDIGIAQEHIADVTRGMVDACSEGGTAWPLFNFGVSDPRQEPDQPAESTASAQLAKTSISLACKTGTAEAGGEEDLPHAWLTAFAPVPSELSHGEVEVTGEPEVSVTVLVEHAGEGSEVAAPIARDVLSVYFQYQLFQ